MATLYTKDGTGEIETLIDTGASLSVYDWGHPFKQVSAVAGIGGSTAVGEEEEAEVVINGHRYRVRIRPAALSSRMLILGRDFLRAHGKFTLDLSEGTMELGGEELCYFEKEFEDLFGGDPKAPRLCNRGEHVIITDGPVPKCKIWPMSAKNRSEVEDQLRVMLKGGIVEKSSSPATQNVLLVNKADGGKRFCIDFRRLNEITKIDPYPLPSITETFRAVSGCKLFTQLDLASGYWTVGIRPEDRWKTAFSIPGVGKYQFTRMPFGLVNAQATLQRVVDEIAGEVRSVVESWGVQEVWAVETYVDNFLIASQGQEVHQRIVTEVLRQLDGANMSLRSDKCTFYASEMCFLGYVVNGDRVKASPENIGKILDAVTPTSKKAVQQFLGLVNFNRHFFDKYTEMVKPLYDAVNTVPFRWGEHQEKAWTEVKNRMRRDPQLCLPRDDHRFLIDTDASEGAIGAVLYQEVEGERRVISYFSKVLSKQQRNWSVTDKELFAVLEAVRHFPYEVARGVTIFTDHQPLVHLQKSKQVKGKVARWLLEIQSAADYTLVYKKGCMNEAADCLSRLEVNIMELGDWGKLQQEDESLKQAGECTDDTGRVTAGPLRKYRIRRVEGVLMRGSRPVVPQKWQQRVVVDFHGEDHAGVDATLERLRARVWFKGMQRRVEEIVLDCQVCRGYKGGVPNAARAATLMGVKPGERISLDFADMAPGAGGRQNLLVITDVASGYILAIPTIRKTAQAVISGVSKWFGLFGIPKEVLADQGQGFEAEEFAEFLREKGVEKKNKKRSSPYHPQGNGRAEKSVGIMTSKIRCVLGQRNLKPGSWVSVLDEAMLGANTSQNRITGMSPFQGMFGRKGPMVEDRVWGTEPEETGGAEVAEQNILVAREEHVREQMEKEGEKQMPVFRPGQEVLLRRECGPYKKLKPQFGEGYTVVRKVGPVNWVIRNAEGKEKVYHYSKLRAAGKRWERTELSGVGVMGEPRSAVSGERRYPRRDRRAPQRLEYTQRGIQGDKSATTTS